MLNPDSLPLLTASEHALFCTSHARCTAVALLTNVLPLTLNGRSLLPEFSMAGAAMPPTADAAVAPPFPPPDEAAAAEVALALAAMVVVAALLLLPALPPS